MSHRLQVLIPEALDARIRKEAERRRVSKEEWVRRAIEASLRQALDGGGVADDPLAALARLEAPTGDIEQMLSEIDGCTSTEVLQEILYRYSALRRLDLAGEVYDLFVQLCPVVHEVALADTDRARDLLLDVERLSARDAIHAAVMLNHRVEWIASFDDGFDGLPGIQRFELTA